MAVTHDTYPNSTVFVNKLGITNPKNLISAETDFSTLQYQLYRLNPLPATFDLSHLQAIHRWLFGEIYEWAGELRGYDIRKGICEFTPHTQIEYHATRVYNELQSENYLQDLALEVMIQRLAYYYDMTNRLHPFPEGNGRTQRLFIEHLAANAGYLIDWSQVHAWQIVEVAEQSFKGDLYPTCLMFEGITTSTAKSTGWNL